MKLSPQHAPLYGECVLTVELDEDEVCGAAEEEEEEEEEEAQFYLLFLGSTQRHLTSTLRLSQVALQAVSPAHNVCEQVLVRLCVARPGRPVVTHSQESFRFVQDLALDMAHFLLDNTAPEEALLLDNEQIPLKECEKLDRSLALALRHLSPPQAHTLTNTHTAAGANTRTADDAYDNELETGRNQDHDAVCRLLLLASAHGLSCVASFLLQQWCGRQALSCTDARGLTPAQVAASRGHHHLLHLFARYEDSSEAPREAQDGRSFYPEGRVFQHHAGLDTYTLTFPAPRRREGEEAGESGGCLIGTEVEELRRLIQLHRQRQRRRHKVNAAPGGCVSPSQEVYSNGGWEDAAPAPAAEEERVEVGSPRQSQRQSGPELRASTPAAAHGGRSKKNKRRTARNARRAAEWPGESGSAPEAGGASAQVAGSPPPTTLSAAQPEQPPNQSPAPAAEEETRFAVKCANRKPVAVTTVAVTGKQEGGDGEVERLIPQTQRETPRSHQEQEAESGSAGEPRDMGQEQSLDPGENQSEAKEPGRPDSPLPAPPLGGGMGARSPAAERRRPEAARKTTWYNEGQDSDFKEAESKSVWYDGQAETQQLTECEAPEQLLEGGLGPSREAPAPALAPAPAQAPAPAPAPALAQPHAAGVPPASSHGSAAQRREVRGSQREEEVGAGWKEGAGGGAEGGRAGTQSRKNSETADNEEAAEERPEGEDKEARARKRRKKKRGKKGGCETKLSSGSSLDSQSPTEAPTQLPTNRSEPESGACRYTGRPGAETPAATEETHQDAMHLPRQTEGQTQDGQGPQCRAHPESAYSAPGFSQADVARTQLSVAPLSQLAETKESAQEESSDLHKPVDLDLDSPAASTQPNQRHTGKTEAVEIGIESEASPPAVTVLKEVLGPLSQTLDNEEGKAAAAAAAAAAAEDQTGLMEANCPQELPVKQSDPAQVTEDSFLMEFPEQHVQSVNFNKTLQPACPEGEAAAVAAPRPVSPTELAGGPAPSLEGTADVVPLQTQRGSGEANGGQRSEHCLASETLSDGLPGEKDTDQPRVCGEDAAKEKSEVGEEASPSLHPDQDLRCPIVEQEYNEELVATAIAVVAIAVAKASFEVSQHLAPFQQPSVEGARQEPAPPPAPGPAPAPAPAPTPSRSELHCCEARSGDLSVLVHAPASPWIPKEETQAEAAPVPHAISDTERDSQDAANEASGELQQDGRQPCPVVDTGQPAPAAEGQHAEQGGREDPPSTALAAEGDADATFSEPDALPKVEAQGGIGDEATALRGDTPMVPSCCDPTPSEEPPAPPAADTGASSPPSSLDEAAAANGPEACGVDAVDGWKDRERGRRSSQPEDREEPPQTESRLGPAAEEACGRSQEDTTNTDTATQIQREKDVFYPNQPRPGPQPEPGPGPGPGPGPVTSCSAVDAVGEESGRGLTSQSTGVSTELNDHVFKKPTEPAPRAAERSRGPRVSWPPADDTSLPSDGATSSRCSSRSDAEDAGGGVEEEERKDQLPENPLSSAVLRTSIRSLSPLRRHSWEPGRTTATAAATAADMDLTQRSSLRTLSGEARRAKPPLHRRSMSWCPSNLRHQEQINDRSYSLEGLEVERRAGGVAICPAIADPEEGSGGRSLRLDGGQERGSLVSLTEEEQEGDASSIHSQSSHQALSMTTSCPTMFNHQTLTKSISMVAISQRDVDGGGSFSSNSGSLDYSISEEEPGPLRSDAEAKGGPKISRTFSYLRSKMTKKGKEKEKEKRKDGERDSKDKRTNSHVFISITPSAANVCQLCTKPLLNKEAVLCNNCGIQAHRSCRESLPLCMKSRSKQQLTVAEATAPGSAVNMRSKSTSSASSVSSVSSASSSSRERWSTATTPDEQIPVVTFPRRPPSIFNTHSNLAKSISTSNIAGLDDVPLRGLKFLSQSTDSLHQASKVNASTESLTDEGTEMMDSQLMGEFELDVRDLEADSWSGTVDKKFLKTLKKDQIKRQDVIYELYQTEFHHVRTLKIMSEVYYKGIQKELQLDTHTLDKIFPVLDDLLETHTRFLNQLLEQKRASSGEGQSSNNFLICCVGDVLVNQFSGCCADRMKKVYGKFCSRHNEAVNLYKELHAKDKRFQAFIKRIMSSSIVRRLSIPECILLVTQRITKYPVLIQRILQHTKDTDEDHSVVSEALRCVKELITAVDSKVNEQEKKRRLREVHSRTDSKSIMRMKSGQMFAKEDLIRGRKLLHDGALQLKNSAGRLKDVQAMLLSDVLVFLQEKDQKYVFASLDQRSTVISLQNLIVREVANEERGLFLITAGIERPEMVEVLASSKDERNTWRTFIQDAMHCMEKDEDEGVPSETEEDRRQQENRVKEIRELLRSKDEQILSLLEEKVHIFRELSDGNPAPEEAQLRERMLFRATPDDVTKGEPIIRDALSEVETLHTLVSGALGGAGCGVAMGPTGGSVGPVSLPRRAETFGGFDSHQMSIGKNGEKEEGDESLDLRRTESDSVLKKGATASLQMLLKRNNEVQQSVTHLHDLLISLQAVVVQQDSFMEEQRQSFSERLASSSSRHSSSSSLSSCSSSRPSSLIEQEKHRSLERQRQEAANLQKQQAAHLEERRRREREWEQRERELSEREERLRGEEQDAGRQRRELTEERDALQRRKEEYQRELERLRDAQRRLDRDKEQLRREESERHRGLQRTPSSTSEDSLRFHSSGSLDLDTREAAEQPKEVELSSSAPTKEPFLRIGSKRMGKNFNPFSSSSSKTQQPQGAEKEAQLPGRLLKLAKPKDKKDKKKKQKGGAAGDASHTHTEDKVSATSEGQHDSDIFFC